MQKKENTKRFLEKKAEYTSRFGTNTGDLSTGRLEVKMINYFMKKYAMSQTGANNLRKAVFSRTILNLTKMFPPMIAFMFIFQSLSDMDTAEEAIALTPQNYVLIIWQCFLYVFLLQDGTIPVYIRIVYSESANVRVDIANRLKKLPLSYFGKRNISDLAATMMGDMSLYEEIFFSCSSAYICYRDFNNDHFCFDS